VGLANRNELCVAAIVSYGVGFPTSRSRRPLVMEAKTRLVLP
jgi:hypothetical protein